MERTSTMKQNQPAACLLPPPSQTTGHGFAETTKRITSPPPVFVLGQHPEGSTHLPGTTLPRQVLQAVLQAAPGDKTAPCHQQTTHGDVEQRCRSSDLIPGRAASSLLLQITPLSTASIFSRGTLIRKFKKKKSWMRRKHLAAIFTFDVLHFLPFLINTAPRRALPKSGCWAAIYLPFSCYLPGSTNTNACDDTQTILPEVTAVCSKLLNTSETAKFSCPGGTEQQEKAFYCMQSVLPSPPGLSKCISIPSSSAQLCPFARCCCPCNCH